MRKSLLKRSYNKSILVGQGLLSYVIEGKQEVTLHIVEFSLNESWAIIIYMFLLHTNWAQESRFDYNK